MKYLPMHCFVAVMLIFSASANAFACACEETLSISDALERSSMVFVGKVRSVVDDPLRPGVWSTRVSIERSYKGIDASSKTFDLLAGDASPECTYTLGKEYFGTKWLFYVEQPKQKYFYNSATNTTEQSREKFYWVSPCSRTRLVEKADDDLDFLNDPEKYKGKTRLSGTILNHDPIRKVAFRLVGNGLSFSPTVHPSGYFEFFDFPPGQYTLEIEPPPGFSAYRTFMGGYAELEKVPKAHGVRHTTELTIKPGEHVGIDFQLYKLSLTTVGVGSFGTHSWRWVRR